MSAPNPGFSGSVTVPLDGHAVHHRVHGVREETVQIGEDDILLRCVNVAGRGDLFDISACL
jgi:hypothetical protein